jgi:urocanate reductase
MEVGYTTDIIIIGSGNAGLCAAATTAEMGNKVIVLEKRRAIGGNSIISGGIYNAVDPEKQGRQDIFDSKELHFGQTLRGGDFKAEPELVWTLVDKSPDGFLWLEANGMKFQNHVFALVGSMWPRSHQPLDPAGTGYIKVLRRLCLTFKVELFTGYEAEKLIYKRRRVVGVRCINLQGKEVIFRANKGVVISTGGFSANVEMRSRYNSLLDHRIPTTNHPGATGDGILMAIEIGAVPIGMEYIQISAYCDPKTGRLQTVLSGAIERLIYISKEGKRFVDEGERRDIVANAFLKQKDATAFLINDSQDESVKKGVTLFGKSPEELIKRGHVIKENSLQELAYKIEVPIENLLHSVSQYNKAVELGYDSEFGRTILKHKIEKPPFYACPRTPAVHYTMGGVRINTKAQVLDEKGNPIKGLFAAGEVTGGIHGTNRLGGNAIPETIVFGRIAGENVAKEQT